jgi:ADP-ribose pyrophosphatase YjhB (NUDIX family)
VAELSALYGRAVTVPGNPPIRRAARALILDAEDRVLLFRAELPGRRPWWFAPGGALDAGETYEVAVVREVMEETGLAVDIATLSSPVWLRDVAFLWNGVVERHIERYFVIRVESHHVDTTGFEAPEAAMIGAHRWWALDEIIKSEAVFAPADLGAHLDPLLRGELPETPVMVGE